MEVVCHRCGYVFSIQHVEAYTAEGKKIVVCPSCGNAIPIIEPTAPCYNWMEEIPDRENETHRERQFYYPS